MWCCVTPERREKTERIMMALAQGTGGRLCHGKPPDDGLFAIWGHKWMAETMVPRAHAAGRPYWFIDNGYWRPAKGTATGYYSLCYRGLWPLLLDRPDMSRLAVRLPPWRPASKNGHILLALPDMAYGRILGYDMNSWLARVKREIKTRSTRQVLTRDRRSRRSLENDMAQAAVVVTHSSKVAVDAVRMGVPAIVAPTNPAAPVCATDLAEIDDPPRPDRAKWWASLMCQQFSIDEMRNGIALHWMKAVAEQADGGSR